MGPLYHRYVVTSPGELSPSLVSTVFIVQFHRFPCGTLHYRAREFGWFRARLPGLQTKYDFILLLTLTRRSFATTNRASVDSPSIATKMSQFTTFFYFPVYFRLPRS